MSTQNNRRDIKDSKYYVYIERIFGLFIIYIFDVNVFLVKNFMTVIYVILFLTIKLILLFCPRLLC